MMGARPTAVLAEAPRAVRTLGGSTGGAARGEDGPVHAVAVYIPVVGRAVAVGSRVIAVGAGVAIGPRVIAIGVGMGAV